MPEIIRTFVCIDLPNSLKTRLEKLGLELQKQSTTRVSWVKAVNMHLTLKFLGDVEVGKIKEIQNSIENASLGINSFSLTTKGLGAFPNLRHPRLFWAGIEDKTKNLDLLQNRIEQELITKGFGKSDYPFSPHLTIGRVREGVGQDISGKIEQINFLQEEILVSEVILMRSDLKPSGAVYTKLGVIKLDSK